MTAGSHGEQAASQSPTVAVPHNPAYPIGLHVTTEATAATSPLLVSDDARVRTLTLNRPEALNACNEALYDALTEGLLAAADDPAVAVVLLTGAGRAFCAGTDLSDVLADTATSLKEPILDVVVTMETGARDGSVAWRR